MSRKLKVVAALVVVLATLAGFNRLAGAENNYYWAGGVPSETPKGVCGTQPRFTPTGSQFVINFTPDSKISTTLPADNPNTSEYYYNNFFSHAERSTVVHAPVSKLSQASSLTLAGVPAGGGSPASVLDKMYWCFVETDWQTGQLVKSYWAAAAGPQVTVKKPTWPQPGGTYKQLAAMQARLHTDGGK